jgi:hypothetical protein
MIALRDATIFLFGFLAGGLLVRVLVLRAVRRFLRPRFLDEHSIAARRAVMRHLLVHGTVNAAQMERLVDAPRYAAERCLEEMERAGLVAAQRHRGKGKFYTRR